MIKNAKDFSTHIYKDIKRLNGEYLHEHTHRVYNILKKSGVKKNELLSASLLHHALDGGNEHASFIYDQFGEDTYILVDKYKSLSNNIISNINPKDLNSKLIVETYISIAENLDLLALRIADKTDNIKSINALSKEKAEKAAERAMYIYAPLSKFLGFHQMQVTLEDESFRYLNPDIFNFIIKYKRTNLKESNRVVNEFKTGILSILSEMGVWANIYSRGKHNYSIYKKLLKYGYGDRSLEDTLKMVYDIAAIRIIVNSEEDCYLVENVIDSLYEKVHSARDDYIALPKESGYKSIHNAYQLEKNIIAEVQIRTKEMHETNEFGKASHLFYKFKNYLGNELKNDASVIKHLNYWMAEKPQIELFKRFVYVFTPQGHIRKLTNGATVIDFAYEIHRDIGHNCLSAKVNGKIVKLSTTLNNGDIIEITTSKNPKPPSEDWLEFVQTNRALKEIRKALRKS